MYMAIGKCCVGDPPAPIFHWNWGSRWLPNTNEIYKKKRNVHGQRKKLSSPNARNTNMLVFFALGNAKVLSFALGDAKLPNANVFASQWNIGFNLCPRHCHETDISDVSYHGTFRENRWEQWEVRQNYIFFFNCIFYQLLRVQHSCSSTKCWGSVLPSIVETRDQNSWVALFSFRIGI